MFYRKTSTHLDKSHQVGGLLAPGGLMDGGEEGTRSFVLPTLSTGHDLYGATRFIHRTVFGLRWGEPCFSRSRPGVQPPFPRIRDCNRFYFICTTGQRQEKRVWSSPVVCRELENGMLSGLLVLFTLDWTVFSWMSCSRTRTHKTCTQQDLFIFTWRWSFKQLDYTAAPSLLSFLALFFVSSRVW